MGTIIRSADWFGIDKLILSKNCADIYNPKVIRASMGSIFRVTCMMHDLEEFLSFAKKKHYATYAASVDERAVNLDQKIEGSSVLVVGNEARGISENVKNICEYKIKIPGYGKAESLNAAVACGILMYEFSRQLHGTKR
jgi:TrmH family RNA methyltransferase